MRQVTEKIASGILDFASNSPFRWPVAITGVVALFAVATLQDRIENEWHRLDDKTEYKVKGKDYSWDSPEFRKHLAEQMLELSEKLGGPAPGEKNSEHKFNWYYNGKNHDCYLDVIRRKDDGAVAVARLHIAQREKGDEKLSMQELRSRTPLRYYNYEYMWTPSFSDEPFSSLGGHATDGQSGYLRKLVTPHNPDDIHFRDEVVIEVVEQCLKDSLVKQTIK